MIFVVEMLHHLPTSSSPISTKSCQVFLRYEPSKIGRVSFFSLFCQSVKIAIKTKVLSDCLQIWYTEKWDKGTLWYQIWLQYHKWSQSYKWLFAKNNTNMLSCLQSKPLMARSWKSAKRQGNYWTSKVQQKNQQRVTIMRSGFTDK